MIDEFRGDIDVYPDGSAQLRPWDHKQDVVWGKTLSQAIDRWERKQPKK